MFDGACHSNRTYAFPVLLLIAFWVKVGTAGAHGSPPASQVVVALTRFDQGPSPFRFRAATWYQ